MLHGLGSVFAGWLHDQRESWRLWLAWRREERACRSRFDELVAQERADIAAGRDASRTRDEANEREAAIREEYRPELEELDHAWALSETRYLRFEAVRLGVALPQDRTEPRDTQGNVTHYAWYPDRLKGESALTDAGRAELRANVAAERRRRREPLIAYVGLIAALTGLVAVTAAHCRRQPIVVTVGPESTTSSTIRPTTSSTTSSTSSSSSTSSTTSSTTSSIRSSSTTTSSTRPQRTKRRRGRSR